jgi:hypothetical protein
MLPYKIQGCVVDKISREFYNKFVEEDKVWDTSSQK